MVTLLFTSIVILIFLVVAVYFWQRPSAQTKLEGFDDRLPLPVPREHPGLFGDNSDGKTQLALDSNILDEQRELLLSRAAAGDNKAADEAHKNFDRRVYDEILRALVKQADSDARLVSVLSHITRNELPVSKELAQAAIKSWENSPDRGSTSRTLHITALADNARLYQSTVESALKFWRAGLLLGVSAAELRALFDGEFWVLSTKTRNSGAGFILKRALAKARRELEAATRVN